jgi:hypothetical protein
MKTLVCTVRRGRGSGGGVVDVAGTMLPLLHKVNGSVRRERTTALFLKTTRQNRRTNLR